MRSVSRPYRSAIINTMGVITYNLVSIPIWTEFSNSPTADIHVGNAAPVKAWIRLLNQTADDDSPKCQRQDMATIQIQVQVSFNANSGSYEHSERIMDVILEKLFSGNSGVVDIEDGFHISELDKISERNLTYQDNSNRIYMTMAIIRCRITQ